jgi:hypothetical protein
MVDFDIHGPWPLVLLAFCAAMGIPAWIGYLVGRVRTLDPHGRRRASSSSPGAGTLVFGFALLFLGAVVLAPMVVGGLPHDFDGEGLLLLLGGVLLFGFGALYVRRAVVDSREAR